MPLVEFGLQTVTFGQQSYVFGCQVLHDGIKALPKLVGADTRIRQNLGLYEMVQVGGDLKAMNNGAWLRGVGHGASEEWEKEKRVKSDLRVKTRTRDLARFWR